MPHIPAVLSAKIRPPRRSGDTLHRTRLLNALHDHADRKLQIVIAPPGFGKTTLLADFAHDAAFSVCWLTLDAADRDVVPFLESVVAAVRRHVPQFGTQTLAMLHDSPDVERRIAALARTLAAEAEAAITGLAVLILDDYHEVNDSAAVTQLMDELLRRLPDNLRIVLAGRALPRLTVSRLIVEGQLFGLGEADLRFTAEELMTLLRRRHTAPIGSDQALALAEGAEGWIAGFLLSVPRLWEGIIGGMIATRGGEGPLYDYLAAEAFDHQPPDLQRFLLATAVPDTADLDLCEALLGPGDWRALLDKAEAAGLFVTRLRGGRSPFRYHQLFRQFLQTRLRRTAPVEYTRLHALAARHLAERGVWSAAIVHFREAGQETEAVALAARVAPDLERAGRWRTLADTVAALPPAGIAAYPSLLVAGARAALVMQDLPRAEDLSERMRRAGAQSGDRVLEASGYACLGNVRRLQGRTREALQLLGTARALAPNDGALVAAVRRDAGQCLGVQGDFAGAAAELREALAYFDANGSAYDAARAEFGLGVALARSGQVAEAITRYESALERWRRLGDAGMEAECLNSIGYAYVRLGDYPRARAALDQALERLRDGSYPRTEAATLHSLGEVLLTVGRIGDARATFERGLAVAQDSGELWMTGELYASLALVLALDGERDRAEELAHHAIGLAQRQDSAYLAAQYALVLGAVQLHAGRPGALTTLHTAADRVADTGSLHERARAHLWLAQAHRVAGAVETAHRHLKAALEIAAELGADAVLDLHARWDPTLFTEAAAAGIEPDRLRAALGRAHVVLPAPPPVAACDLPGLAARAFGPGALVMNGSRAIEWAWDKSRELFFLLLSSGPRRPEQIMASLWPDSPPVRAKTALHQAVYRLRRSVIPEVIITHGGVYRINEELVTSYDVREFERLHRMAGETTGDGAASLLQQAADLYTAPFLEDLDAEWCADERARLEQRYLAVLEQLIDAYAAAGRPRDSIAAAERLLRIEPYREDVHAGIVRTLLRLGDRAAALQHYERAVATLRDELGVDPGPELQTLLRRIRA